MKKDIIYIDVEDDITAIIGKVKESKEKIVALVPPKRIGVLQSAVNLRLLQRTAEQNDKRIVLITGNQALAGLAASASIPTARNLQSKPELAEIPVLDIDNGDDVIDGSQLPIGDHAEQVRFAGDGDDEEADLIHGIDIEHEPSATPPTMKSGSKKTPAGKRVPNFNSFRKKLIIAITAGILLIGGLVWAFVFAPAATVIITARTTTASVNDVASFGKETNAERGTIKAAEQVIEKDVTVEFEATGEKDVGERATGVVKLSTGFIGNLGTTVPTGTLLTSASGKTYQTDAPVTFTLSNYTGAQVDVTASESGESFNGASGSLSGTPSNVSASFVGATSGGTSKKVAIVTAADVQAAKEKLVKQSTDEIKRELSTKFDNGAKVIEASFAVDYVDIASKPATGSEASDKKATLTGRAKYTLSGIEGGQLKTYLEQTLKGQMRDQTVQKIYSTGADKVQLNDFTKSGNARTIRIIATGQIGPIIDEAQIKEKVAGKRYGDIRDELTKIDGVNDVNVKFSFFWVRSVPRDLDRITIEFDVENGSK
jgi:hypothetical protein